MVSHRAFDWRIEEEIVLERVRKIRERLAEIDQEMSNPDVFRDNNRIQSLGKERSELAPIVVAADQLDQLLGDLAEAESLLKSEDEETREYAESEKAILQAQVTEAQAHLEDLLLPKEAVDDRNSIIEIRAGTGGEEAALFASDLLRMYMRYVERHGWKAEMLSSNPTGIGGFKEVIFAIRAKGAYSFLKFEGGVHRVQRVPATEASGRIHTSTATVAVLPEAEEVDVNLKEDDLRIDRFCSSGPGGQSVNTTYSAVRLTHIPTGLVVSCQDERSQIKNLAKAKMVLRSRLLEAEMQAQREQERRDRGLQVRTGQRNEKIRTYNFPQSRLTDHRIGFTSYRLPEIMDGDLDELITALNVADRAERLATGKKDA